jgi:hypothetical protein
MLVSAQIGQEKCTVNVETLPVPPSIILRSFKSSAKGLVCVICHTATRTIDTRTSNDGTVIRRRRTCINGHRFTTYETIKGENNV